MHSSLFFQKKITRVVGRLACLAIFGSIGGCEINDLVNPGEPQIIGKDRPPLVVPILDTLAPGIEESDNPFASATDIRSEDLVPEVSDYKIGKNDLISVAIMELNGEGTGESLRSVRVSETGNITLPYIQAIKAEGLTEEELRQAVVKAYQDAKLIRSPQVSVTVANALARTFSIQGNVGAAGEYTISRPDFRMLDAMVTGRAPKDTIGVDNAYILRKLTKTTPGSQGGSSTQPATMPDLLAPQTRNESKDSLALLMDVQSTMSSPSNLLAPGSDERSSGIIEGRPAPMDSSVPANMMPPGSSGASTQFTFEAPKEPSDVRVIRVPIKRLLQYGDLKFNLIIRPGDMIVVPEPTVGIYYMGGHVQATGAYSLSGTKVTLKAAWAAAHGPDDFTIPGRSEVIRRVGDNKEVFVRLDLGKILAGEQPDLFLKPDDEVYVGTDLPATFLAAIRNSFRITYGFGFLYDRNFYTGGGGF